MTAQELGVIINRIYVDEGKSGTEISKREGYQQMVDDIESKKINLVITKDFNILLDLATRKNVRIYFYLTHEYYDPAKGTIVKIKGILAEDFSRNLSLKIREAHELRQKMDMVSYLQIILGDMKPFIIEMVPKS